MRSRDGFEPSPLPEESEHYEQDDDFGIEDPQEPPLSPKERAVVIPIQIFMFLFIFGPPLYFYASYTGFYRWLAEFQLWLMGFYVDAFTLILNLAAWGFTAALFVLGGVGLVLKRLEINIPARIAGSLLDFRLLIVTFFMSLPPLILAVGLYLWIPAAGLEAPETLNIAQLDPANIPSRYLKLEGARIFKRGIAEGDKLRAGKTETGYFPAVPNTWKKGDPVTCFVELWSGRPVEEGAPIVGMVNRFGLPGSIRHHLKKRKLNIGDAYIVIDYDATPRRDIWWGKILVLLTPLAAIFIYLNSKPVIVVAVILHVAISAYLIYMGFIEFF